MQSYDGFRRLLRARFDVIRLLLPLQSVRSQNVNALGQQVNLFDLRAHLKLDVTFRVKCVLQCGFS